MSSKSRSKLVWVHDAPAAQNARLLLPALVRDYFKEGREFVDRRPVPADLHEFRLATKRFRYTLELFRNLYGPAYAKRLDEIKPIQTALGEVNDCVATRAEFGKKRAFRDFLDKRAAKKANEFYTQWTNAFDTPGREAAWLRYVRTAKDRSVAQRGTQNGADSGLLEQAHHGEEGPQDARASSAEEA